ncbi:MAG: hypothetical protein JNM56_39840, partial [Planctomycetia bacterium]|nr:hypothetical protein [Planctomycetia bacterium]
MSEAQEPQPAALPPASTPAPAATERLRRDIAGLDRLSVLALLVLTFFLSSFVVRNTDYWLHLAAGRLLAEGKVQFGVDPFAYTTGGVYWVNHSWLYDLLLYGFTSLCRGPLGWDGTVVVVLKALAMTLLASVLLSIRRRGVSLWLPVLCTTLAVLAAASRMILGPISVSMLLLGLTLYFLIRDGKPEAGAAKGWRVLLTASPRRLWVLPPLFALWVNLDGWFILGPLLVGLYWLGEALQEALAPERGTADAPAPEERRTLLLVLLVGLAACLLNPHHIWAVTQLPPELFAGQRFPALRDDPRFLLLFLSPFDTRYLSLPVGLNFAGMAYYPLLVLGAISWIASRRWRAWRLLMWFVFALLSASSMLLVPFFALVAGPITALNLQDIAAARRVGKERDADTVALKLGLIGRVLTLLLLVGLTVAAWPGWLHLAPGNPQLERRVAWGVEVEPSLKEVSYKLAYWRMQGWLGPDDRGFNLLPESANAFAWFCPEQKGFIDSRYSLFRHVLGEYEDVRRALLQTPAPTTHEPPADWQAVFRKHGINHVILSGSRSHQSEQALRRMLADADQWTLLYLDGRTAIFGWNDPQRRGSPRFTPLKLDLTTAAFGSSATQAPELGPGRAPRAR